MSPSDLTAEFIALIFSSSLNGQVNSGDARPIRYTDHIHATRSHSSRPRSRRHSAAVTVAHCIPNNPTLGYHGPTTVIQDTSTLTSHFHRTTYRENVDNSIVSSDGDDEDGGANEGACPPSTSMSAPVSPPSFASTSLPASSPEPESEFSTSSDASSTGTNSTFPACPIPVPFATRFAVLACARERAQHQAAVAAQLAAGHIALEQQHAALADTQEHAWVEEELLVAAEDATSFHPGFEQLCPVSPSEAPIIEGPSRLVFIVTEDCDVCMVEETFEPPLLVKPAFPPMLAVTPRLTATPKPAVTPEPAPTIVLNTDIGDVQPSLSVDTSASSIDVVMLDATAPAAAEASGSAGGAELACPGKCSSPHDGEESPSKKPRHEDYL